VSLQQEAEDAVARCWAAGTDLYDVEAKSARGGIPRKLERTISAFATSDGGLLLLGVSEDTGFVPLEVDAGVVHGAFGIAAEPIG
jgi:ATP-dependent DNA helicase RecG